MLQRDPESVGSARLNVFKAVFADLDDAALKAGTLQLIADRASAFAPSAGELRAKALAIADQAAGTVAIDEYEAWSLAQRAASTLGRDTQLENVRAWIERNSNAHTAQIVAEAIRRIGWQTICNDDEGNANTLRAQFRDSVKAIQARAQVDRRTLPQVRQITQALAARLDASTPRQITGSHTNE
jgi:hypothetical protein